MKAEDKEKNENERRITILGRRVSFNQFIQYTMKYLVYSITIIIIALILANPIDLDEDDNSERRTTALQLGLQGAKVMRETKAEAKLWTSNLYDALAHCDTTSNDASKQRICEEKTVIVTGTTSGLGKGIAAHFALFKHYKLILPVRKVSNAVIDQILDEAAKVRSEYYNKNDNKLQPKQEHAKMVLYSLDLSDMDSVS